MIRSYPCRHGCDWCKDLDPDVDDPPVDEEGLPEQLDITDQ